MAAPRTVGVIGGGVAGLACAARLTQLGVKAVVFDTGKRGPGGRASSRMWRGHAVDHAVQFAAATDPAFSAMLQSSGAATRWGQDGRFGVLSKDGFQPSQDKVERWIGRQGFGSVVEALTRGVDLRRDVWVPPSNGIRRRGGGIDGEAHWAVAGPDRGAGEQRFDAVVIAHNGKCAERLTSSTPATEIHALLRTDFAPRLRTGGASGSGRFTLNQVYSLLLEVPTGALAAAPFDAAFVENEPILKWISSNTAKFGRPEGAKADVEAWTVLSSGDFGRQHKVPQESLPGTPKEAEVTGLLLDAVERAVGLEEGALRAQVLATKLQLWGAGLPINRWESPDRRDFVWSAAHSIGIAGDWLAREPERASTVEAAWLSGTRLAEHIAGESAKDIGLQLGAEGGAFVPVEGDFGSGGAGAAPAWVAPPSEGGYKGSGKGKSSGKGGRKGGSFAKGHSGKGRGGGDEGGGFGGGGRGRRWG